MRARAQHRPQRPRRRHLRLPLSTLAPWRRRARRRGPSCSAKGASRRRPCPYSPKHQVPQTLASLLTFRATGFLSLQGDITGNYDRSVNERFGTPEEIAAGVLYLTAPEFAFAKSRLPSSVSTA